MLAVRCNRGVAADTGGRRCCFSPKPTENQRDPSATSKNARTRLVPFGSADYNPAAFFAAVRPCAESESKWS